MTDETLTQRLVRVGTGEIPHLYRGDCPQFSVEARRDRWCKACAVLLEADRAQEEPADPSEPVSVPEQEERGYMPGGEPGPGPCLCGRRPDPGVRPQGGCWCAGSSSSSSEEGERAPGADPVLALMAAGAAVRGGSWIHAAPSHVFAELLAELDRRGWTVTSRAVLRERLTSDEAVVRAAARAEWRHDPPRRQGGAIVTWDQLTPFQMGQYEARARITLRAAAGALLNDNDKEAGA